MAILLLLVQLNSCLMPPPPKSFGYKINESDSHRLKSFFGCSNNLNDYKDDLKFDFVIMKYGKNFELLFILYTNEDFFKDPYNQVNVSIKNYTFPFFYDKIYPLREKGYVFKNSGRGVQYFKLLSEDELNVQLTNHEGKSIQLPIRRIH